MRPSDTQRPGLPRAVSLNDSIGVLVRGLTQATGYVFCILVLGKRAVLPYLVASRKDFEAHGSDLQDTSSETECSNGVHGGQRSGDEALLKAPKQQPKDGFCDQNAAPSLGICFCDFGGERTTPVENTMMTM